MDLNKMTNDEILDKILNIEKGLVNDPTDLGGLTNYGISTKFLKGLYPKLPDIEIESMIRNMTPEKAKNILLEHFVNRPRFDFIINDMVKYAVIDTAVNFGPERAILFLQTSVGTTPDGIMGVNTINKTNSLDSKEVIRRIVDARLIYRIERVKKNMTQLNKLLGWIRRDVGLLEMLL